MKKTYDIQFESYGLVFSLFLESRHTIVYDVRDYFSDYKWPEFYWIVPRDELSDASLHDHWHSDFDEDYWRTSLLFDLERLLKPENRNRLTYEEKTIPKCLQRVAEIEWKMLRKGLDTTKKVIVIPGHLW